MTNSITLKLNDREIATYSSFSINIDDFPNELEEFELELGNKVYDFFIKLANLNSRYLELTQDENDFISDLVEGEYLVASASQRFIVVYRADLEDSEVIADLMQNGPYGTYGRLSKGAFVLNGIKGFNSRLIFFYDPN
jgi:hypothetical protein